MPKLATNLTLAIALLLSGGGLVMAGGKVNSEAALKLVGQGEILALDEILRRNEAEVSGRIIEIELEHEHGLYIYEIKILRPDGRTAKFKIDARTGAIARRNR